MAFGREPAHVVADLGNDNLCADIADAGYRRHMFDGDPKGRNVGLHLLVDRGDGCIESIDLIEMKAQQKAMVLGDATAKGLAQLLL